MASERAAIAVGREARPMTLQTSGAQLAKPILFLQFGIVPSERGLWIFEGEYDYYRGFIGTWRRPTGEEALKLAADKPLWEK